MLSKANVSPLIFFHIPKTAGSTLRDIIFRAYPINSVFEFRVRNHEIQVNEFVNKPFRERQDLKAIIGHMPFGMHEYFPQSSRSYFTMLRHPVERALSNYYWILKTPGHRLHDFLVKNKVSLEGFILEDINPSLNNGYIKYIGNLDNETLVDATLYERVLKRIEEHFVLVGITERFDESILLLQDRLNWNKLPCYKPLNTTGSRLKKEEIGGDILDAIRLKNSYDLMLYNAMNDKLTESIEEFGKTRMRFKQLQLSMCNKLFR
jgi:hypothetical protein